MALKISSDFSAMATSTLTQLHKHQSAMGKSIERISTGYKINGAEDGPLKYYLANRFDMKAEEQNATNDAMQTGASYLNMADKALSSILNTLKQMRESAYAVANGAVDSGQVEMSQVRQEFNDFAADIKSVIANTMFNGKQVLNLNNDATATVLIDATNGWATKFTLGSSYLTGINSLVGGRLLATQSAAESALKTGTGALWKAIDSISALQGKVSTALARVNNATSYLDDIAEVNIEARDSIKNADMAKEMTEYVKQNVLAQASQAMLSQANSGLASVLNLLS